MKAVIFDMDGLLIDSERIIHEGLVWAGEQMGVEDMHNTALAMLGLNQKSAEAVCLERYGADFDYKKCTDYKHEYIFSRLPDGYFPIKPFVRECLEMLRAEDIPLAVASSSREGWVKPSLEYVGIKDFFDVIICGDMVTKSKPDPQIFLTAAEKLGAAPKDIFVLEDSYNGIRAAYAAEMIPIMIPDLLMPSEEMLEKAAYIAENPVIAAEYIIKA